VLLLAAFLLFLLVLLRLRFVFLPALRALFLPLRTRLLGARRIGWARPLRGPGLFGARRFRRTRPLDTGLRLLLRPRSLHTGLVVSRLVTAKRHSPRLFDARLVCLPGLLRLPGLLDPKGPLILPWLLAAKRYRPRLFHPRLLHRPRLLHSWPLFLSWPFHLPWLLYSRLFDLPRLLHWTLGPVMRTVTGSRCTSAWARSMLGGLPISATTRSA